jgi:periplasmic divalent cation tolerance protein
MPETLLVMTTMPDEDSAKALAEQLVEGGLAACVNVGAPMASIYQWEGQVTQDSERLLTIKTTVDRYAALEDVIVERHPYELPELIAVPITHGLSAYLAWIEQCTRN